MKLYEALGIGPGDIVSFSGAGGKSGAIIELCRELSAAGMRVLAVPTTKLSVSEAGRIGDLVTSGDPEELASLVSNGLPEKGDGGGALVAGGGMYAKDRVSGVEPSWVPGLAALADVTLVESDGSRGRQIKGTAAYEPVMPEGTTIAVAVGGSGALGRTLGEETVHRPELFSELTGIRIGHSITARAFAAALAKGSLGNAEDGMRRAIVLTGVEPGNGMSDTAIIARELWRFGITNVVMTSLPLGSPPTVWNA